MSERLEVLVAYRRRETVQSLHLSSLRFSVHSTVTECKEEESNEDRPKDFVTPTFHAQEVKRSLTWICGKHCMYSFQKLGTIIK